MQDLKNKESFLPVYLIRGEQDLLVERELENIKKKYLDQINDFNYFVLDGESTSGTEILEIANTNSMFDSRKLVVIKNSEKLKSKDLKIIESYIDSPSISTCIIFLSVDSRKPPFKKNKNLGIKTFDKIDDVENSILEESVKLNLNLTYKAARIIHDLLGNNLRVIRNELIKLSQFYTKKEKIDEQKIRNFIADRKFENIFELTNAISSRDKRSALKVLSNLESHGQDAVSILSTISWRLRQINQAKTCIEEKLTREDTIRMIGISKGAYHFLSKHAQNFTFEELNSYYRCVYETDKKLKSTSLDSYGLLTKLILDICDKK